MRNIAAAALIVLGLGGCVTADRVPDNPQRVIKERVQIMKGFGAALSASGAYAQGKAPAKDAQAKVAAARAGADRAQGLFQRGTALGDKGVTASRALSTIFVNRADFEGKLATTARAFAAIDAALARGAKADVSAALVQAKGTCGACHARYRAADE
jgi:cytochrome c556